MFHVNNYQVIPIFVDEKIVYGLDFAELKTHLFFLFSI